MLVFQNSENNCGLSPSGRESGPFDYHALDWFSSNIAVMFLRAGEAGPCTS